MKSLWKNKIYTLHKITLLNFKDSINHLQIVPKELDIDQINLKITNRFLILDSRLKSNNTNLKIYNGKFFYVVKFKLSKRNNFKYGELSFTRRMGLIHKTKKKNKQLIKKKK